MGMSIEDCIHKLDFSIGAYQKLIDENVANGEVVGTGVRGTWTASTPLNKAYSDMIEALQIAKETMRKYQQLQADYEARLKENNELINDLEELRTMINKFAESYETRLKADMVAILTEIQLEIEEQNHKGSNCYRDGYTPYSEGLDDCKDIIQQKINALKAESEDQDGTLNT